MKIVFMGTPDYAVGALRSIIQAGHEVTAVLTQPDKPKGRGKEMQCSPVKECAEEFGIPVFQPVKIKAPEAVEILGTFEADIFVVAAFGQILSREILEMPKYGCINIHASLLPKYRGAAPIQWAILNGEKESGVTIMQMDVGVDTGDMLFQKKVPITDGETGESLYDKIMLAGAELVVEALPLIERGEIRPEKQKDEESSYAKMLTKSLGQIDWEQPAVKIERLVRGLNSWPSAYTKYRGKTLKVWEAAVIHEEARGMAGTVAAVDKDCILVNTGGELLALNVVQIEGKKKISVHDFLLGYPVSEGNVLG